MGCNSGKFWLGIGIGTVVGALAYHCSRTARAQKAKADVLDAIADIELAAEAAIDVAKHKAKANGIKVADKIATKANEVKDKLNGLDL